MSGITTAVSRLRGTLDVVYREMLKFGAVGAVAFVVDVGLFNVLTSPLWFGSGDPPLDGHEKLAKVLSASIATVVAWLGNRYWSFRHRRQSSRGREFLTFVLMNGVAMVIAVLCLAFSHDVLGFTSQLADNISGNVVGIGLGTLFRFWAYRTFVFLKPPVDGHEASIAELDAAAGLAELSAEVDLDAELASELDRQRADRR